MFSSGVTQSAQAGGIGMAAKVEGEADAAEARDPSRQLQVVALVAAPAVDEQHAGNQPVRLMPGAGQGRVFNEDVDWGFAHYLSETAYLVSGPAFGSTPR